MKIFNLPIKKIFSTLLAQLNRFLFDRYVEVYWTYSLTDKAKVGAKLHAAHIPYRIQVRSASGPMRSARGLIPTIGLRNDYMYHYTFLIRQSDFEMLPTNFFYHLPQ